jgi:hypothetical protein
MTTTLHLLAVCGDDWHIEREGRRRENPATVAGFIAGNEAEVFRRWGIGPKWPDFRPDSSRDPARLCCGRS